MQDNTPHFRRLTALVVLVLAPGLPPGNGTVQSAGAVTDNVVLLGISTPIALGVLLCLGYSLVVFRERPGSDTTLEGPAVRGNSSIQMWWLVVTTTTVLFLAAFGSIELLKDGAGGGQGPNPMSKPAGADHALQIQVIAQQWEFTYRFPGYGGVETNELEIPADTTVEFHVTSLDVIHSFWAYQLGVKADATPGLDNIAYVQTLKPMNFEVHCAELCGVYHGYMYNSGKVVPKTQFVSWIGQQSKKFQPVSSSLPAYSGSYFPQPTRRGG
jgi:cytochrome c oxidase subunit 2